MYQAHQASLALGDPVVAANALVSVQRKGQRHSAKFLWNSLSVFIFFIWPYYGLAYGELADDVVSVQPLEMSPINLNVGAGFVSTELAGLSQRQKNEHNTESSNDGHYYSRYEHVERPTRHYFRLSYKVALGALMFVCGVYYFGHAFRNISSLSDEAGSAYLILGMSLIACGVFVFLASGFSYF